MADRRRLGAAGCLALLAFLIVELIAGFGTGYVVMTALWDFLPRNGLITDEEAAGLTGVFAGMAAGAVPVFLIDHLCKRLVGESAIEQLGHLPTI